MSDIVERLRKQDLLLCQVRLDAADEIERLRAEIEEWKQAASVEAGLRREANAEIERLRAAVRICIMLFANEQMATYEFLGELRELADGPF